MSILNSLKLTASVGTLSGVNLIYSDKGISEASLPTNLLGADDTTKLFPRGTAKAVFRTRSSKGGVAHANLNVQRQEPNGEIRKNPADETLYLGNKKISLSTASMSVSLPTAALKDPVVLARVAPALKADMLQMVETLFADISATFSNV